MDLRKFQQEILSAHTGMPIQASTL